MYTKENHQNEELKNLDNLLRITQNKRMHLRIKLPNLRTVNWIKYDYFQ